MSRCIVLSQMATLWDVGKQLAFANRFNWSNWFLNMLRDIDIRLCGASCKKMCVMRVSTHKSQ